MELFYVTLNVTVQKKVAYNMVSNISMNLDIYSQNSKNLNREPDSLVAMGWVGKVMSGVHTILSYSNLYNDIRRRRVLGLHERN